MGTGAGIPCTGNLAAQRWKRDKKGTPEARLHLPHSYTNKRAAGGEGRQRGVASPQVSQGTGGVPGPEQGSRCPSWLLDTCWGQRLAGLTLVGFVCVRMYRGQIKVPRLGCGFYSIFKFLRCAKKSKLRGPFSPGIPCPLLFTAVGKTAWSVHLRDLGSAHLSRNLGVAPLPRCGRGLAP